MFPTVAGSGSIALATVFPSSKGDRKRGSFRKEDMGWSCWEEKPFQEKNHFANSEAGIVISVCRFPPHFPLKGKGWGKGTVNFHLALGKRSAWKEARAILPLRHFAPPAPSHFSGLGCEIREPAAVPGG